MSKTQERLPKRYICLPQFAEYCGLSKRFLRDALRDPENPLPHYRLGHKTILIHTDEFDEWVARYRVRHGEDLDALVEEVISDLVQRKKPILKSSTPGAASSASSASKLMSRVNRRDHHPEKRKLHQKHLAAPQKVEVTKGEEPEHHKEVR